MKGFLMNKVFTNFCQKVKLVITDVDGVLTDGGMYYSKEGEILKKFNTRDGMAVELLLKSNIKTIFLTREKSEIVKKRAKKVNVAELYLGIRNKELILPKICKKFNVTNNEIIYIGDDINDIEIMKMVGFSACPRNANKDVVKISNYKCIAGGGEGVLREIADIILSKKKN